MRLTKNSIQKLQSPATGDVFVADDALYGFFVKVTANGNKSFYVKKKSGGKLHKVKICDVGVLNLDNARAEAQKILAQLASGQDPLELRRKDRSAAVTLREAVTAYLAAKRDRKPRTVRDYQSHFGLIDTRAGSFSDWLDWPIYRIQESLVLKKHRELGQQRGNAQANQAMRYLSAVLEFAFWEYRQPDGTPLFPVNPVKVIRHTRAWHRVKRAERVIPRKSLADWHRAWREAYPEHSDTCDLLLLLLLTGMRLGEGCSLRWTQVDFARATVTLLDTKARNDVTFPLAVRTLELLRRRHAAAAGSEFVFPAKSKAGHIAFPYKACHKIGALCGVAFSPHDLRRTHHTVAVEIGIEGVVIDRLQNHAVSESVMRERYFIASVEYLREAAERIAEAIFQHG